MLAATGRTADTQGLGLESLGVAFTKSGKVIGPCKRGTIQRRSPFSLIDNPQRKQLAAVL